MIAANLVVNPIIDELCRWDSPGGTESLFLSAATVRELRAKAIEAFLSLPRRGVETGGLLFGNQRDGRLFIQGFEEIPCEHRYGPSFALSNDDRARLTDRLARDSSPAVIGVYRSYTGRDAELDDGDLTLIHEHFPTGQFVFLLLQPVNAQACIAGFRLFRDGEVLAEPSYAPALFDPDNWNTEPPLVVQAEPAAEPEPESAPEAVIPPEAPEPAELRAPKPLLPPPYRTFPMEEIAPPVPPRARVRWWVPVALCLMGGIGGAAIYELWAISRQPRWVELYLDAKPAADAQALAVTWDAAAARSTGATHALLGVNDGSVHRDIPLSTAQLQLGRYLYAPANRELELRLVLYGNGPALSGGSLRLEPAPSLAAAAAPPSMNSAPANAAPPTAAAEPRSTGTRKAVHEVQPSIPAGIRARLNGTVDIPVTVKISPKGLVTSAYAPSVPDGIRAYLSHEAVRAAHLWRFAPSSGSSEKTIYFTFAP
uniref:TonB C-terminal domain-containing protein n=1 Tax=Solibacter usitatus (strain Ellin6076) TaxID=234267 RepID=Q02B84_SOLUE